MKVVIDIGFDKEIIYDQKKKMNIFQNNDITQSSAQQRAGRAGRTAEGICFRLFDKVKFEKMDKNKLAEIKKIGLELVVLKLKQNSVKDIYNFE